MNRRRVAAIVAVLVAVLALARCGGDLVALGRTDAAQSFQTFRNGSFLITVTDLAYSVQEIPVDAAATSRGVSAYKPKNGQFIVFYATAIRVGSLTMPKTLTVQSDPHPGTTNPPTLVRFG